MRRILQLAALALAVAAPAFAQDAPEAAPALPAWLAGCWEAKSGESWTEECWTRPRGGLMLGSGRFGKGETIRDWEVMQIMASDSDDPAISRLTFFGMPKAQGRTPFHIVQDGRPGLTFMNADHDYPQRIRYWREGEELLAEIALKDGSKARRWRFRRAN